VPFARPFFSTVKTTAAIGSAQVNRRRPAGCAVEQPRLARSCAARNEAHDHLARDGPLGAFPHVGNILRIQRHWRRRS
jgi:hypothetical protein